MDTHWSEQTQARARDIARIVAAYYQGLRELCVPEVDAWAKANELEARLWADRIFRPDEAIREVERLLSELRTPDRASCDERPGTPDR